MFDSHHPHDYTVETDPISLEVQLTSRRERVYLRLAHLTGAHILIRVQKIGPSGLAEGVVICHLCGRSFGQPQIARDINLNLVSEIGQTPVRVNLNLLDQMGPAELLTWRASRVLQNGKKVIASFQRVRQLFWVLLLATCLLGWASFITFFTLPTWTPFCLGAFALTGLGFFMIERWLARIDRRLMRAGEVLADLTTQMEKMMAVRAENLMTEIAEGTGIQAASETVEKS
jgi:hypothetical protein